MFKKKFGFTLLIALSTVVALSSCSKKNKRYVKSRIPFPAFEASYYDGDLTEESYVDLVANASSSAIINTTAKPEALTVTAAATHKSGGKSVFKQRTFEHKTPAIAEHSTKNQAYSPAVNPQGAQAVQAKGGGFLDFIVRILKWKEPVQYSPGGNKIVALLLMILPLGISRFYTGYPIVGILQLVTISGLGLWWIIDFIRILLNDLQPNGGSFTSGNF